jgi:peptidoglycan/xylan/chitin deacetylase (PgdA/CDA1 family)
VLLDLLRETGTPAALFCVGGKVDAHPEIVARAAREGHLIGSHTYVHRWNTNLLSSARLAKEIERAQESVARAAGARPAYFRPPFGLSNPRLFRVLRRLGLRAIGWSARGLDTGGAAPDRVVARLARGLKPGAILLLHDGGVPADRLLATVRALLDTLRARGYTVVRLDRLLGDGAPDGDLPPRRHDARQPP